MKAKSLKWQTELPSLDRETAECQLLLYFGPVGRLEEPQFYERLREAFPLALICGCSAGGQIGPDGYEDASITALALSFDKAVCRMAVANIAGHDASYETGRRLGSDLAGRDLAGIIVLSDGLLVNGSELARGIASELPRDVPVAGGMAGDDARFARTLVGANAAPREGAVAAIAFYGASLRLRTGIGRGWAEFGPRRMITASEGSVVHTLDGVPALQLYEKYLGEEASELPGSGLRFPLQIRDPERPETALIRTLLAIDRTSGSLTFAGSMPANWSAQLMRSNFIRLTDGAKSAAVRAGHESHHRAQAALLVSCIGRRLVLGQRSDDEIEAVRDEIGIGTPVTGFYSFGEFSPHGCDGLPELHNQTMTVVLFEEAVQ